MRRAAVDNDNAIHRPHAGNMITPAGRLSQLFLIRFLYGDDHPDISGGHSDGRVLTFTLNPNPSISLRLKRLTPAAIPHMNKGRKLQTGENRGDDFVE